MVTGVVTRWRIDMIAGSGSGGTLLDWIRNLFSSNRELGCLEASDLERVAGDIGVSPGELKHLAAQGDKGAELLHLRMAALGITAGDVERLVFGLSRDLETDCARCGSKGVCSRDLEVAPSAPGWMAYCANAATLDAVSKTKGRALI
jgi:hypothetical protein